MSDTIETASPDVVVGAAERKRKAIKRAPTHPPIHQMVIASIVTLKERGGSSLYAIKKYIAATYKVDVQKLAHFIKKYLKSAVISENLVQTTGKGASGSFKLSAAADKEPKAPKAKSFETFLTSGKKKPATLTKKVVKKKVKNSTPTKKAAEKKKPEMTKARSIKKTGTVKANTLKPKAATTVKVMTAAKPKAVTDPVKPKKAAAQKKAANKPERKK